MNIELYLTFISAMIINKIYLCIDSINSVEDTKGNNGERGKLYESL